MFSGWMDGWMDGWIDGWMGEPTNKYMTPSLRSRGRKKVEKSKAQPIEK